MYNGYEDEPEHVGEYNSYMAWLEDEWLQAQLADLASQQAHRRQRMATERKSGRMKFIPEMKDMIAGNLAKQNVDAALVAEAFRAWEADEQPTSPWLKACFNVFEHVQAQVDSGV